MKYIIRGIVLSLIPVILNGLLKYVREPKRVEKGQVYLPRFFAILGAVCSAVLLIPAIICAFLDEELWVVIGLFLFALFCASPLIGYINCRIFYDDEGFVAKNIFGIKRRFTYDQVTGIKENLHEKFIYLGKKRVMVDEFYIGGREFVSFAKKKYRTLNNGQSIPRIVKDKYDIFKGNIEDSTSFLVVFIITTLVFIGAVAFVVFSVFSPNNPENTASQKVCFDKYYFAEDNMVMISEENLIYKISSIDKVQNQSAVEALCDGKSNVTVYFEAVTPDDESDYRSIKAIVYDDDYVLSFEETNEIYIQDSLAAIIILNGLLLAWIVFMACSIVVGRNPRKFSKKVVRMFFKDEYVKY